MNNTLFSIAFGLAIAGAIYGFIQKKKEEFWISIGIIVLVIIGGVIYFIWNFLK